MTEHEEIQNWINEVETDIAGLKAAIKNGESLIKGIQTELDKNKSFLRGYQTELSRLQYLKDNLTAVIN
jgi:chromosome segregation ATPase